MDTYIGGCVCGAVRFELFGHPRWVVACHCDPCKKRTGSAFGISAVFDTVAVQRFDGPYRTFERWGDSGKSVRYDFCSNCGTTVRWHVDLIGRQVFALGAFDSPQRFKVNGEMYAGDALPWARLGCEHVRIGAPDDAFREAMMAEARAGE